MRPSSFLAPANSSQRFANQPGWQSNPSCISYRTSKRGVGGTEDLH
jgi:hypothetical protein